jgi:hypothetical protein
VLLPILKALARRPFILGKYIGNHFQTTAPEQNIDETEGEQGR